MTFQERYRYNPNTDLLGKGGFATVYRAQDTLLERTVALKFFPNSYDDKHTLIKEISRAISLEHPNLCRYYDASLLESQNLHGLTEKTEVGVMEYLDGGDIKNYCSKHRGQLNKLLTDVLQGLSCLHEHGIIHRDLKPGNVLIKNTPKGPVAKITDFGISKETGSGNTGLSQLMGTIEYMAPEQFSPAKYGNNGKIGTNLDLWSFGLVVYELVTGESMFGSRGGQCSAEQVMSNILNDDLIDDKIKNLPESYLAVVKRCLIKDAKQRVQNADELIGALQGKTDYLTNDAEANTRLITKPVSKPDNSTETKIIEHIPVDQPDRNIVAETPAKEPLDLFKIAVVVLICLIISFFFNKVILGASTHFSGGDVDNGPPKDFLGYLHRAGAVFIIITTLFFTSAHLALKNTRYIFSFSIVFLVSYLLACFVTISVSKNLSDGSTASSIPVDSVAKSQTPSFDSVKVADSAKSLNAPGANYVLNDSFDDNHNNWLLVNNADVRITIQNSKLIIKGLSNKFAESSRVTSNIDVNKDFTCSLAAKWKRGTTDNGFGIMIDGGKSETYTYDYRFEITANRHYIIDCFKNDTEQKIVDWTYSEYIQAGIALNALTVKKTGDYLKFYINDNMVKSVRADWHFGDLFGVIVDQAQTVEFDDFKLEGTNK